MKLILFAFCIILNLSVYAKEKIITTCEVVKNTYVHISPYNSNYKQEKSTNYTAYSDRTGETYTLSTEGQNFNILYKSKKNSLCNWELKNFNGSISVLNNSINNLVIRTTYSMYSSSNEQIYYFNLDKNYNGYLTLLNIRWNSIMDSANNASLYFCECKGAIK